MIYLDNAATTFPKPTCLIDEINHCLKSYCGNPGRSAHSLAIKSAEKVYEARELIAEMFDFIDANTQVRLLKICNENDVDKILMYLRG